MKQQAWETRFLERNGFPWWRTWFGQCLVRRLWRIAYRSYNWLEDRRIGSDFDRRSAHRVKWTSMLRIFG